MCVGYWEALAVSKSCQTGIPVWSNPTVYGINAVTNWCHLEYLGAPATSLGAPTTSLEAPESTSIKPGSADHKYGRIWKCQPQLWQQIEPPAQSGQTINIFGNAVGVPGNHSYNLLFNNF